ncbi:Clavaminate synthase-like protein [Xylaria sp. FL1777]|nr:Clavaminate synthase-like protein [Xylaria sp. FL1777]
MMSIPTWILGRSLRLVSRNIHKSPGQGLQRLGVYCSARQLSQFNWQPSNPDVASDPEPNLIRRHVVGSTKLQHPRSYYYWIVDIRDPTKPVVYHDGTSTKSAPAVTSRTWLRDSCTCDKCIDPFSGQKRFASTDVPSRVFINKAEVTPDGDLRVAFENDFLTGGTHVSTFSPTLWHPKRGEAKKTQTRIWDRKLMTALSPYFSFEQFMNNEGEYLRAMRVFNNYGLIFLRDIPSDENAVKEIAFKFGLIQDTFYGRTWDVVSKPNAENVAYTSSYLGLHQDLLYMHNVPRIQILHCLENTCAGEKKELAETLVERLVTYHYNKGRNTYQCSRPVLSRLGIYWSPPFQKPEQLDNLTKVGMDKHSQWHQAASELKSRFESERNVFEYKMKPGDCAIFDNRRVLHGRREFDPSSGERWLKGVYVENDSHDSLIRSLGQEVDKLL